MDNYYDSESYDSDSFGEGVVPPQAEAVGNNSYGHPSMPHNSHIFHQQSSDEAEEDDDDEEDVASEDDEGSGEYDSNEEPAVAVASHVKPRGKTFRPPVGGGGNSSSSEDEGVSTPRPGSNNHASATPTSININPRPPRGKELRLFMKKGKDDSSDEKPLGSKKMTTESKSKGEGSASSRKKGAQAPKKSPAEAPAKKSPSKAGASASRKRKAPSPANDGSDTSSDDDDDDDDDSDGDACVATIVAGSDSEEVMAVATTIKSSKGGAKKRPPSKQQGAAKKAAPKKGGTNRPSSFVLHDMPEVAAEKAAAAREARTALQEAVTSLPYAVTDSHTIRSFGRIKPEYNASPLDALYSSLHSIYPVGFSCDRFEFSPVHGRVIKMRCDILDGSSLREHRAEQAKNGGLTGVEKMSSEKENVEDLGDGPVFRVTWGEGIDDDKVLEPSCHFDPYIASAHIDGDVDAIAVPLSSKKGNKPLGFPEVGMRVSVRFDNCKMYGGSITDVKPIEKQAKNSKKAICNITIHYDDGVTEVAAFPDPDIAVAYQGCPPVETEDGIVTEMNGKPVRSVLAKSPLEAWGKTLLSLGLIDEIMYEAAMKALLAARNEGFNEVKDKLDAANKRRRDDRAKEKLPNLNSNTMDGDDIRSHDTDDVDDQLDAEKVISKADSSPEEVQLRDKLAEMQKKLERAKKRSKAASLTLANVRISTISPFAANPFLCRDDSASIEKSWMTAAIKKERALMGNTGNKRKIVTPFTMLDKSDAFVIPKIERLVEGLPGTEFAPSYVFHANRSASGSNQAWIHEAKIRFQKEQQKMQEKARKVTNQSNAKAKVEEERELKRKLVEAAVADKKRLKQEEDDQKKRERVNKRLAQLSSQMDDRLFKEACMMREKYIMNLVRGMAKEFSRRRKATELIVGNAIDRSTTSFSFMDTASTVLAPFDKMLPPLSQTFDAEVVRIWDFLHSFSDVFAKSTEPSSISIPSLDALQDAVVCLKTNRYDKQKSLNAVNLFKEIAIGLCKVISPGLTKILSSSTQYELIGKNGTEGGPQEDADVSCLPVTEWSWREIARMIIIYDVLTDLGYSKQEAANLVKGYRSGGHPNSKEAKRWKKIEESPVVIFYHRLGNLDDETSSQFRRRVVRARLSTPCTPSSVPCREDWRFYLHNIKSTPVPKYSYVKECVTKSLAALRHVSSRTIEPESVIADLEKCLAILERSENGNNIAPGALESHKADLQKAKNLVIGVLDSTGKKCVFAPSTDNLDAMKQSVTQEPTRQMTGLRKIYQMSKEQFKALELSKEEYMAAALRLKEDLERKNADDDANDDEDDDDDEEDGKDEKRNTDDNDPDNKLMVSGEANELERDDNLVATTSFSDKPSTLAVETNLDKNEEKKSEADAASECSFAIKITNHPTVGEKDAHIPTEPAEDFPDGWQIRRIPRLNHNDKRTDRNWYSPKLGLRFRAKSDALRFVEVLETFNGDESAAIMEFRGMNKPIKPANKVGNKAVSKVAAGDDNGADTKTDYDFCEDLPTAPDLVRRCLAVIRALCASNSADQFIYPVDPQLYPGYYETVMNPSSLYDVGNFLQVAGEKFSSHHDDPAIEEVVAEVGRKVRTIVSNSIVNNSSNSIVNSAEEMSRIFERLFFDWVLAPTVERPEIEYLDDDMCIDHHESDAFSMVLLCDACEGKYNMSRLKPALDHVPNGDWYCPRCVSGRSWLTADPRIGKKVQNAIVSGIVQSCKFLFSEDGIPSIIYRIKALNSGHIEYWGVEDVDSSNSGSPVEPLRCLQALAESPGYGFGRDSGIVGGAIPLAINPLIGDKAAQAALSSGVFKDTVSACVSLTNPPEDLTADEWIQLLMLLVTKCSQSDELQELSSKLENKENSRLATDLMSFWRARAAKNIVANVSDDDTDSSGDKEPICDAPYAPSMIEDKTNKIESPMKNEPSTEIATKDTGEEASADDRTTNVETSFSCSIEGLDVASNADANATALSKDSILSEEDLLRRKREASFLAKSRREKKREDALMGYYIGNELKSTAETFDEDFIQTIVKSVLCNQEEGLDLAAVRCREPCHYCGLSDVALGAPLCRTPNEKEWREIFPHAVHNRTTYMMAEIPDNCNEEVKLCPDDSVVEQGTMARSVRVRVGGELVSSKFKSDDNAIKNFDLAMQQFLPRNSTGFQSELKFRKSLNLSFLSGSLSAHEVCAIAAHRSLKEKLLAERRAFHRANMSRIAALSVGKTIPIGTDPFGRTYWVFKAEPTSLFVCQVNSNPGEPSAHKQLHRFHKPEEIASVIVCLGKHPLCDLLKEAFPVAAKALKNRSWSTFLLGQSLPREPDAVLATSSPDHPMSVSGEQLDLGEPFVEDEDVLVESEKGKFLWEAVVLDVSKDPVTGKVNGYLVHFKNWSSRFDQWVVPDRVVEPSKVNLEVQEEVLQDFATTNDATPQSLESMFAYQFLNAKKRARSTSVSKTDLFECAITRPGSSHGEILLGQLKSAILLIESALPRGSVGYSGNGSWTPESAAFWRNFVKDAQGPESLMRCVLLLEDAINPDWLHSQATQLYACIPKQFRAVGEASLSSIALRVTILDRCLKYQQRKKKHHD